jgi:hypothetical protein
VGRNAQLKAKVVICRSDPTRTKNTVTNPYRYTAAPMPKKRHNDEIEVKQPLEKE